MKDFIKNKREFIALFLYACFIGALINYLFIPLLRQINDRRDSIQEEISNQEAQKNKLLEIPKIKNQYNSIIEREAEFNGVFLRKEEAVTLIERLEKLASETNNEITISIPEADTTSKEALNASKAKAKNKDQGKSTAIVDNLASDKYLEIKISLVGNFNSIVEFMSRLENIDYYSDVISFDIKKEAEIKNYYNGSNSLNNPFLNQEVALDNSGGSDNLIGVIDSVFYLK